MDVEWNQPIVASASKLSAAFAEGVTLRRPEWIRERDLAAEGVRLFCLPHAGSGSAGFYRWRRLLKGVNVCPVHLPGRDARLHEPALTEGELLASELHDATLLHLNRPYAIFGHSMGALLAFRWARQIQAAGLPAPLTIILSGRAPRRRPGVDANWLRLDDDTLLRSLDERFGGNSFAMLQDTELRAACLPVLRADLQVVESLAIPHDAIAAPLLAVCGDADPSVDEADMRQWQPYTSTPLRTAVFPGGHFYHFSVGEAALLHKIEAMLHEVTSPTS